ncbi:hypothetical protein JKL49_20770 [Phenylobacterium sp. 20VBR1]|uniref:Esterase-like activity of phytase family protein n=1 Tax=Phenylobacterium glaciei TaxID=2803784 RepID=A0A941D4P4_9CAUL|nr:DUF6454 family protein [Phenylobacterium glaciei]MBR7621837.1 hypothetical protein [Phenylobacterium glaciei]
MTHALRWLGLLILIGLPGSPALAAPSLAERLMQIDRSTAWIQTAAVPVRFATFHPQGMVKVGPEFFVSAVEIKQYPARLAGAPGGRSPGAGVGHLFRMSADGALLGELVLGQGDAYHPGGIDFDGKDLWVSVAEYRPDSTAIVYRVDPATLTATEVLRVADHIGAVSYDRRTRRLQGVSWGGRRFYTWKLAANGVASAPKVVRNPSSYIDYQDCHSLSEGRMLCSGLADYRAPKASLSLGGLEIVDLKDQRPVWQAPVPLWAPSGRPMTQNPVFVEAAAAGVRAWFMPDDDPSTLFAFEALVP